MSLSLFFIRGFAAVLIGIPVPKLKSLSTLGYTEVMLIQFAVVIGDLVFLLPAGAIVRRFGDMRGIVAGRGIMAIGGLPIISMAAMRRAFASRPLGSSWQAVTEASAGARAEIRT